MVMMHYFQRLAIQLGDTDKPLKLIGKWPSLLRRFSTAQSSEPPSLYVRRNVFYPSLREQAVSDWWSCTAYFARSAWDMKLLPLGVRSCHPGVLVHWCKSTHELTNGGSPYSSHLHFSGTEACQEWNLPMFRGGSHWASSNIYAGTFYTGFSLQARG